MNKEIYNALLAALKAKFEGVSDAVLDRVIKNKFGKTVTTTEQVEAAVAGVTWQSIIDSYGDSRATEAQVTAVSNYEKKHGMKDGVKIGGGEQTVQQPPKTEQDGYMPAWAKALVDSNKALVDSNKALTDKINALEGDRITASRKAKLSAVVEKLPETLRKAYERTPVDKITDEEFETLLGEITTEVDGLATTVQAKGSVFGKPSAQNGRQAQQTAELSKEQIDAISKRDAVSKENQPF